MKAKKIFIASLILVLWSGFFYRVFWSQNEKPLFDFMSHYTAAKMISIPGYASHIYALDVKDLSKTGDELFLETALATGYDFSPPPYVYPPFIAWLLQPLSNYSYDTAKKIRLVGDAMLFLLGLLLLCKEITGRLLSSTIGIILPICLFFFHPLKNACEQGNSSVPIFGLLCCSLALYNKRCWLPAGILLGFCLCIKSSLLIIIFLFFIFIRLRDIVVIGLTIIFVLMMSVFLFGSALTQTYIEQLLLFASSGGIPAWQNQSCIGMLLRFYVPANQVFNWQYLSPSMWANIIDKSLLTIFLTVNIIVAVKWRKLYKITPGEVLHFKKQLEKWAYVFIFNSAVLIALICMPLSWSSYTVLALLPLSWVLFEQATKSNWRFTIYTATAFILISVNPLYFAKRYVYFYSPYMTGGVASLSVSTATLGNILLAILFYCQVFDNLKKTNFGIQVQP